MLKTIWKRKWLILTILIILGAIGAGVFFATRPKPMVQPETSVVTKVDLTQSAEASGVVKAAEEFFLDFDTNGRVRSVFVHVGDQVKAGDILAELETTDLDFQVERAQNQLALAKANLNQRTAGEIPEAIYASQLEVRKADAALSQAKTQLANSRRTAELAVRVAELNVQAKQLALTEAQRTPNANASIEMAELALTQAQYDLQSARLNAETNVSSQEASAALAEVNRESAQANLNLKQAQIRPVDRAPLEASVADARTAVAIAKSQLAKARIVAPADGIVTDVAVSPGESGSQRNGSAVTMLALHAEIEADVSETDIARVKVGQAVRVTLDAFGDSQEFSGTVISINPAQTVVQDIVYYKVRISLTQDIANIRPGMSANVKITTDSRQGVFVVPRRAVTEDNGISTVDVLKDDGTRETRTVELGLAGDGGMVEVVRGLNEGERIITSRQP